MTHLDIAKKHEETMVIFDKYSGDLKPKHAVCFFTDIVNEDEPRAASKDCISYNTDNTWIILYCIIPADCGDSRYCVLYVLYYIKYNTVLCIVTPCWQAILISLNG